MKKFLGVLMLLSILSVSTGCHSGLIKGVGSDFEKLGNHMQK